MWETIPWLVVLAVGCAWLGWRDHQRRSVVVDAQEKANAEIARARDHYFALEQDLIARREKALTRIWSDYMERIAAKTDVRDLMEQMGKTIRDVVYPVTEVPEARPTSPDTVGLDSNFHENGKPEEFVPVWEEDSWMADGKEEEWQAPTDDQLTIPGT